MKEIFGEYGSMVLAAAGTFALLMVFRRSLIAPEGLLAQMISYWGNGGC